MLIHCLLHGWDFCARITQCARWCLLLSATSVHRSGISSNALFQSQPWFAPIVESVVIAATRYYQMNYPQQEQTTEHFL